MRTPCRLPALLFAALAACSSPPCGVDGHATLAGATSVCVYPAEVVIIGGFVCPAGYDVRLDSDGAVCASDWITPSDLGEDACAMIDCAGLRMHLPIARPECESLDPAHCLSPFPSDRFRTATGALEIPPDALGPGVDEVPAALWARPDGFGPTTPIALVVEGAIDDRALAGEDRIAQSVAPASTTVLLDVSGRAPSRVPHVAEIDRWPGRDGSPTTLWIRPLRLELGHRYVVGVRRLARPEGEPVPVPAPFRAIRDGIGTDAPALEERRAHVEEVIARLEESGVPRHDLHLAWDFTVASERTAGTDVRDLQALVGAGGDRCALGPAAPEPSGGATRAITLRAPAVTDGAALARDATGTVVAIGEREVAGALYVPPVARPRLVLIAHALSGSASEALARPALRALADERGVALAAIDLEGSRRADVDLALTDLAALAARDERSLQGALDLATLARALPACEGMPEIAGAPHLLALETASWLVPAIEALAGDAIDGVASLGPSGPPSAWARRSVIAANVDRALATSFPDAIDRDLLTAASATWALPLSPPDTAFAPHRRLLVSIVDSTRAPPLLARLDAARLDVPLLVPSVVDPQTGRTSVAGARSAWVAFDSGLPPASGSTLPSEDRLREAQLLYATSARDLLDAFLAERGSVVDPCGGPCGPPLR